MMKRFAVAVAFMVSLIAAGCSKDDDNNLVETWRGNYTYYGTNEEGNSVELTESVIFVFENDFDVIKQSAVYDGGNLIDSLSKVCYGAYSRTGDKLILHFDECDCAKSCDCLSEANATEKYYYRYTYYADEDFDEDEDDVKEDNSFGTLELRRIDDDDPETKWVVFRYLEWVD